ncbi:hypothetical protein [Actinoplanes subglobosus]|uniref:Uncharacterized protein n=1 Tax=Actinoplanes subglobosus TaxID=1547892 RepID=A0ABV8ITL5_9ACTN
MGARDSSPSAGAEDTSLAAETSTPSGKHAETRSARASQDGTAASHSAPASGNKGARTPRSRKPETGTTQAAPPKKPGKPFSGARSANPTEPTSAPPKSAEREPAPAVRQPKAQVDRWNRAPQNDLDFEDRHVIRATDNPETAQHYAALRKDQRRDAWQRLLM